MSIEKRRYHILSDFTRVHKFLTETYDKETLNSYLLPQYFEYAHGHSYFNFNRTHRNHLWEESGKIVGIACFEMNLGEAHLHTKKGYDFLLSEMLLCAEKELCKVKDEKHSLKVWITDKEPNKRELLQKNGYSLDYTDPVKIFDYQNNFADRTLPEGFTIIKDNNFDYSKLQTCYWQGFDHGDGEPDEDIEDFIASGYLSNLGVYQTFVVVAPNGDYACALGMFYDDISKYAYLEPLATVPKYRRMGLATICLNEAMKITKSMGAKYCFGGSREFYTDIGFEHVCNRELWKKEW